MSRTECGDRLPTDREEVKAVEPLIPAMGEVALEQPLSLKEASSRTQTAGRVQYRSEGRSVGRSWGRCFLVGLGSHTLNKNVTGLTCWESGG